MVTMNDIAQVCGVSRAVVSLVLNGREKEVGIAAQTRDRILSTAETLGYCRNELARAMVTGRNHVVAVIVCGDPDLEFTQRIIRGALDAASRQNFSVKLFQPHPEEIVPGRKFRIGDRRGFGRIPPPMVILYPTGVSMLCLLIFQVTLSV